MKGPAHTAHQSATFTTPCRALLFAPLQVMYLFASGQKAMYARTIPTVKICLKASGHDQAQCPTCQKWSNCHKFVGKASVRGCIQTDHIVHSQKPEDPHCVQCWRGLGRQEALAATARATWAFSSLQGHLEKLPKATSMQKMPMLPML